MTHPKGSSSYYIEVGYSCPTEEALRIRDAHVEDTANEGAVVITADEGGIIVSVSLASHLRQVIAIEEALEAADQAIEQTGQDDSIADDPWSIRLIDSELMVEHLTHAEFGVPAGVTTDGDDDNLTGVASE